MTQNELNEINQRERGSYSFDLNRFEAGEMPVTRNGLYKVRTLVHTHDPADYPLVGFLDDDLVRQGRPLAWTLDGIALHEVGFGMDLVHLPKALTVRVVAYVTEYGIFNSLVINQEENPYWIHPSGCKIIHDTIVEVKT